jgi:ABC-2 type transport system ATP-binding protein
MNVIEVANLGKQYGKRWSLRNASFSIDAGRVAAIVGPNGAGKTTLLKIVVGLIDPSEGSATVMGGIKAGSDNALDKVAFVAQDAPLYRYLKVSDTIALAKNLNRSFDVMVTTQRLGKLGIGLDHRVGKLSGGQQSQLALALALGRHPSLLILDEPLARLDPLARREFMSVVMAEVANEGLSVVLSSHVVAELERVADYLVVVNAGHIQVASDIDVLLQSHCLATGPADEAGAISQTFSVVGSSITGRQARLLVQASELGLLGRNWECSSVTLEEIILAYLENPDDEPLVLDSLVENVAAKVQL